MPLPRGERCKIMSAKLIIDLAKARLQQDSHVRCSYKHHPDNRGFDALLEMVRFALVCRRCHSAPCVKACPSRALAKVHTNGDADDCGILERAHMLCTGCGTCAIACPFGTIYADLIRFPSSICDMCRGRLEPDEKPLCVMTCDNGSIEYREIESGGDFVEVLDGVVVKVPGGRAWQPLLTNPEEVKT